MDDRFDQILRNPRLLVRYHDENFPDLRPREDEENSRRRVQTVSNVVQRRRLHDEADLHIPGAAKSSEPSDWNYAQLLFVAMIDILCKINEPADLIRQKRLFEKIAKTLVRTGIASPICFSHQLHGLREHVRFALLKMMANARSAVRVEDTSRNHVDSGAGARAGAVTHFQRGLLSPAALLSLPNGGRGNDGVLSRYTSEFEQLEQLGKGGFGAVFKTRHYLDSQFYAVKKISLNLFKLETCFRALREVKNLAMLNHSNVVRYYASWLEFDSSAETPTAANTSSRQLKMKELSSESMTNEYLQPFKLRQCLSSPDISSAHCTNAIVDENEFESSLPAARSASPCGDDIAESGRIFMAGRLVLCLQMELCTSTLRTWLNQRNSGLLSKDATFDRFAWIDKGVNKGILRQILDALAYIHSQGIIHRDLKPGNVFLRSEPGALTPRVLLGDFGLSCYERSNLESLTFGTDEDEQQRKTGDHVDATKNGGYLHSSGMGTLAYSAPEQLKSQFYDCKADMFSFGIIALEMYFPFRTYMERIHNIMRLRKGEVDDVFQHRFPLETALIRQLVQKRASLRPSARQLLEEQVVFVDDPMVVTALKQRLKELEEELSRLRQNSESR